MLPIRLAMLWTVLVLLIIVACTAKYSRHDPPAFDVHGVHSRTHRLATLEHLQPGQLAHACQAESCFFWVRVPRDLLAHDGHRRFSVPSETDDCMDLAGFHWSV